MAGHTKQQFDEYMESLEFDLDVDRDEVNRMIEEDMRQ
jgi:CBS-domain-containing membrane protein